MPPASNTDPIRFLAVRNYARLQHYRDRAPLWIKFYARLLDDYEFQQLREVQQRHLMLLWLLASRHDNRIPNDPKWIAKAIHARSTVDIDGLIASGWLADADAPASNLLAEPEQNATAPRARGEERERRDREEKNPSPPPDRVRAEETSVAERLPSDAGRVALTTIVASVEDPLAWLLEISACLSGMPGHPPLSATEADQVLRDYVGNGAVKRKNFRQFRRYLQQGSADRQSASGQSNGARKATKRSTPQEFKYTGTSTEEEVKWQQ